MSLTLQRSEKSLCGSMLIELEEDSLAQYKDSESILVLLWRVRAHLREWVAFKAVCWRLPSWTTPRSVEERWQLALHSKADSQTALELRLMQGLFVDLIHLEFGRQAIPEYGNDSFNLFGVSIAIKG